MKTVLFKLDDFFFPVKVYNWDQFCPWQTDGASMPTMPYCNCPRLSGWNNSFCKNVPAVPHSGNLFKAPIKATKNGIRTWIFRIKAFFHRKNDLHNFQFKHLFVSAQKKFCNRRLLRPVANCSKPERHKIFCEKKNQECVRACVCFSEKESESECESYWDSESERISMFKNATRLCMYIYKCLSKSANLWVCEYVCKCACMCMR